jgi:hypothetical protein
MSRKKVIYNVIIRIACDIVILQLLGSICIAVVRGITVGFGRLGGGRLYFRRYLINGYGGGY